MSTGARFTVKLGSDIRGKILPGSRPVALITGASSGLGAEFARAVAARNHDLVLVARRRTQLQELADELARRHAVAAEVLVADLASDEQLESVAQRIEGESRLELLVNNAGFGVMGNFFNTPLEPQMNMHKVHVLATVRLTHAALGPMVSRDRGAIINVSSVASFSRMPGHASYSSTKAWMTAFTQCLQLELKTAGSRVRVQALCPGFTYTGFHDAMGVDRSKMVSSRMWWLQASFVVSEALRGLEKGKWLVIPSLRYRSLVLLLKVLPDWVVELAVMRMARKREAARIRD